MQPEFDQIMTSDLPELEKLSRAFCLIINQHIDYSQNEIELLKATGDHENLVKEQIKFGVYEYTLGIFSYCYHFATGRKVQDD